LRWLLDTNVVSDAVRDRPTPRVLQWVAQTVREDTAISVVTLAELWDGATSASDENKRNQLTAWIEGEVARRFQDRTLPVTAMILLDWLRLSRQLSARRITRDAADLLIASTARVHNLTLVTRNVRDFAGTGVVVYDPWADKTHRTEQS
jgi:predicted nucleic acid-binding protein